MSSPWGSLHSAFPKRPQDAFRNYLPGIRVELLAQGLRVIDDLDVRERYSEQRVETFKRLVEGCSECHRLKEAGRIDEAIEFYEADVVHSSIGDDVHERLRAIYEERGEYEGALRVCRSHLAMDDQYQLVVGYPPGRSEARQHFEERCARLEAAVSRQDREQQSCLVAATARLTRVQEKQSDV